MRKIFLTVALLVLGACSTIAETSPSISKQIRSVEGIVTAAETVASAYGSLPLCNKPHSGIACSEGQALIRIDYYGEQAKIALLAARKAENETTLAAAQTAADAYQQITNEYKDQIKPQ